MPQIIPDEILKLIFSYIKKDKCYRCGKTINLLSKKIKNDSNKYFCSYLCIEYQHY